MEADQILYSVGLDSSGFKKGSSNVVNSISYMENSLDLLRTEIKKAEVGSESFKKIAQSITLMENKLEAANQQMIANMGVMQNQGRMAQQTRLLNNELAFAIQDGAYAFNDLRMGVLGMSNNLPRVAIRMKEMARIQGSWTKAIFSTIGGLFSFNGIMSLAVGALVAWTALSGRSKDKTDEAAESTDNYEKSLRGLTNTLEDLIKTQEEYEKSIAKSGRIKELREEIKDLRADIRRGGTIDPIQNTFVEFTPETITKLKSELKLLNAEFKQLTNTTGSGWMPVIKENIGLLSSLAMVTGGGSDAIRQFAETNRLSTDQMQSLTKMLKDLRDGYFALSGEVAKGTDPALKSLIDTTGLTQKGVNSAIEALDMFLGKSKDVSKSVTNTGERIAESIQLMTSVINSGFTKANAFLVQSADAMLSIKGRAETAAEAIIRLAEAQERLNQRSETFVTERGDLKFSGKERKTGRKGGINYPTEEELREHFKTADILSTAAARTMETEYIRAWENIFGKANSLFETFLQNVVQGFVGIAANYVSGGLFSFFSNMFSGGNNYSMATTTTNYLVVDGEVMGKFVDERTPYSVNRAIRLNKL